MKTQRMLARIATLGLGATYLVAPTLPVFADPIIGPPPQPERKDRDHGDRIGVLTLGWGAQPSSTTPPGRPTTGSGSSLLIQIQNRSTTERTLTVHGKHYTLPPGEAMQCSSENNFECMRAALPFRPSGVTPRPTVGTQTAGVEEDLLISGPTSFDKNQEALAAILREWHSSSSQAGGTGAAGGLQVTVTINPPAQAGGTTQAGPSGANVSVIISDPIPQSPPEYGRDWVEYYRNKGDLRTAEWLEGYLNFQASQTSTPQAGGYFQEPGDDRQLMDLGYPDGRVVTIEWPPKDLADINRYEEWVVVTGGDHERYARARQRVALAQATRDGLVYIGIALNAITAAIAGGPGIYAIGISSATAATTRSAGYYAAHRALRQQALRAIRQQADQRVKEIIQKQARQAVWRAGGAATGLLVGPPGRQWGILHIPRIGDEVIIDSLEGNPDRPMVAGTREATGPSSAQAPTTAVAGPTAGSGGSLPPDLSQASRWLAQLAVTIVDYVDEQDHATPFGWILSGDSNVWRIRSDLTTRSNVFAVWVTIGFFEVGKPLLRVGKEGTRPAEDGHRFGSDEKGVYYAAWVLDGKVIEARVMKPGDTIDLFAPHADPAVTGAVGAKVDEALGIPRPTQLASPFSRGMPFMPPAAFTPVLKGTASGPDVTGSDPGGPPAPVLKGAGSAPAGPSAGGHPPAPRQDDPPRMPPEPKPPQSGPAPRQEPKPQGDGPRAPGPAEPRHSGTR